MDDTYDFIILGTGLKEAILSALLQKKNYKVLNIDRNNYYGAESASLLLDDFYVKMAGEDTKPHPSLGDARLWSIDLCPKFLMASGILVKILSITQVTRYMKMTLIPGSYIMSGGALHKVPATPGEALNTSLLGFFEKRRYKNFLNWVNDFDVKKEPKFAKMTTRELFKSYDLSDGAIEFTGHAIALHTNDDYLDQPCLDTIEKLKLYRSSLARFGSSPFIYPEFGLGAMSEGFARLCAINGGLQMLNRTVSGIEYDEDGKVAGVKVDGQTIRAGKVLSDPTYIQEVEPSKVKQTGAIIHSIVFMKHPVPNTSASPAIQLIIPPRQSGRHNDIYCVAIDSSYGVCAEDWYIAVISTIQEKPSVKPEVEIHCAYEILGGNFLQKFTWVSPYLQPADVDADADKGLFITESLDATTHFEVATVQVLEMYKRITGEDFDLTQPIPSDDDDNR